MKTDRELLELAAKAAGIQPPPRMMWMKWADAGPRGAGMYAASARNDIWFWNPLADDGDALRLAAKLNLLVECMVRQSSARTFDSRFAGACDFPARKDDGCNRDFAPDQFAATRRAIVRAAATIGEQT
jgi:hypothetical protein